jgi:hypothetical protein
MRYYTRVNATRRQANEHIARLMSGPESGARSTALP